MSRCTDGLPLDSFLGVGLEFFKNLTSTEMIIMSSNELLKNGSYLVSLDGCVFKVKIMYPGLMRKEKLVLKRGKAEGVIANWIKKAVRRSYQNLKEKQRTLLRFQVDDFLFRARWLPWNLGKEVKFNIHGKDMQTLSFCLSLKVCCIQNWQTLASNLIRNQQTALDDLEDGYIKYKKTPSRVLPSCKVVIEKLRLKISDCKNGLNLKKNENLAIPNCASRRDSDEKFPQTKQTLLLRKQKAWCCIESSESGCLIKDATRHPGLMKYKKTPSRVLPNCKVVIEKLRLKISDCKNGLNLKKNGNLAIPNCASRRDIEEKFPQTKQTLLLRKQKAWCRIESSESGCLIKDATRHPGLMNSLFKDISVREDGKTCQYRIIKLKKQREKQREDEDGDCKGAEESEKGDKEIYWDRQKETGMQKESERQVTKVREENSKNNDIVKPKKDGKKCHPHALRMRKNRKQDEEIMEDKRRQSPIEISMEIDKIGEIQDEGFQSPVKDIVNKDIECNGNLEIKKADRVEEKSKNISLHADEHENEQYASTLIRKYRYSQFSTKFSCAQSSSPRSKTSSATGPSNKGYSLRSSQRCKNGRLDDLHESPKYRFCVAKLSSTASKSSSFSQRSRSQFARHPKNISKTKCVGSHYH